MVGGRAGCIFAMWATAARARAESVFSDDAMRISRFGMQPTGLTEERMWAIAGLAAVLIAFGVLHMVLRRRDRRRGSEKGQRVALALLARRRVEPELIAAAERLFRDHPGMDAERAVRISDGFRRFLEPAWRSEFGAERVRAAERLLFQPTGMGSRSRSAAPTEAFPPSKAKDIALAAAGAEASAVSPKSEAPHGRPPTAGEGEERPPWQWSSVEGLSDSVAAKAGEADDEAPRSDGWEGIRGMAPGRIARLTAFDAPPVVATIMSARPEALEVAFAGEAPEWRPGTPVEVYVDLGRALCGIAGIVHSAAAGKRPMFRLGSFAEVWQARQRHETRLRMAKALRFLHCPAAEAVARADGSGTTIARIRAGMRTACEGFLWDLSPGGCCLATRSVREFAKGDFLQFDMALSNGTAVATLLGSVVGITRGGEVGDVTYLHLQYLPPDMETASSLAALIREWSKETPGTRHKGS